MQLRHYCTVMWQPHRASCDELATHQELHCRPPCRLPRQPQAPALADITSPWLPQASPSSSQPPFSLKFFCSNFEQQTLACKLQTPA